MDSALNLPISLYADCIAGNVQLKGSVPDLIGSVERFNGDEAGDGDLELLGL